MPGAFYHAAQCPPRVDAALQYLQQCIVRESGEDCSPLTEHEEGARNAAADLLRNYFNGELDLERLRKYRGPDDEPPAKVESRAVNT